MRRVIAAREEEEEEEAVNERVRERERESCVSALDCGYLSVCVSVSVCVLTPGARPPSLLTSWRALSLSGSFFTSPSSPHLLHPSIFCLLLSPLCIFLFCYYYFHPLGPPDSLPPPPCGRIFIDRADVLWMG